VLEFLSRRFAAALVTLALLMMMAANR